MNSPRSLRKRAFLTALFVLLVASLLAACRESNSTPPGAPATGPASTGTPNEQPLATPTAALSATTQATASPAAVIPAATATPQLATRISGGEICTTPTLPPGWVAVSGERVLAPILMYHRISDKGGSRYTLPIDSFRAQMKLLHDEGYQTVSVSQLAGVIRHGGALPEKPVVLTFDDGYSDVYQNAFPIMKEYGFTGVVYVITSTFEDDKSYGYMQPAELKELIRAGWEIGSHGVTHTDLNKTRVGPGNEMKQSKAELEKTLGVEVKTFSYPFAVANGSLKDLAEETGYQSAVGVDIFVTHLPKRLYFLSRREVHRAISISGFHKLLVPGEDELAALHLEQTATAEPGTAQ